METNILCEKEERTALANLYEGISVLLQDSDDEEEKRKIKKALQGMSANTTYIVLGETGSGKTGILRNLFQDVFEAEPNLPGDICEYRWGEQDLDWLDELEVYAKEKQLSMRILDSIMECRKNVEADNANWDQINFQIEELLESIAKKLCQVLRRWTIVTTAYHCRQLKIS